MKKRTNSSAINNPIILLIFFLTTFNGNAQINDLGFSPAADLIPKTPEASSVIKYQDMPVSYYTGVPSVQIPIGGMKQGPLFVNFNLSYHAGGHRPSEVASSVGLGWDLKGHGMITRKVNGTADDNTSPMGFLQMRESYNLDQNDPNNDLDKWIQQEDERMLLNMVNGTWDTQPDEFYFDFNGYSGKMVFDVHNDLPIVSSNAKIRVDSVLGVGKISGWVMTDPNGVRYEFKEYEETAVPSPEAWGTVYTRTAWLLTKMISPYNENDFIEFDYQDYTLKPDHSTYYSKKLYKESSSDKLLPAGTTAQGLCSTNGYAETNFNYNFSTVYGKQLISVSSSEGQKIIFSYLKPREDVNLTSQAPSKYNRLDVITFLNPSQIEKFNLDYYPNTSNLKLQLKSITQVSTTGQTLPPYQFTYHSSVNNNTNSKAVDHWGFYNGSNPNLGLPDYTWVSKMEVNGQTVTHTNFSPGSDMQPNFAAAQTGILKEIQYPTGAITELEYELNDCSYINDKDLASEGLFNYQNESYTCESFGDVSNTNSWVRDTTVFQVLGDSIFAKIQAFGFTDDHWSMKTPQAWIEDKQGNILYTWNIHPQLCLTHPNPQMRPDGTPQPLKIDGPDVLLLNAGTYKLYTKAYHTNSYDDTLIDNIKIQVTFEQPLGADTIMDVGGLRVKRIIKKNKNNIVESTRRFDYSDGQYSSGVIYSLPKYDVVTGHLFEHCIGGVTSLWNFSILCEYYTLTGANRLILSTTSGSHIGYGHVTEYFEENGEFGKIARTYSTPIQYPDEIYKSKPFVPALSQSFKTGLLLKEETYKNENSIFKPIKSVENEYAFKTYEVPLFKAAFGKYPWFDPDATCNNGSIGIEFYYYALPWHQKFVSRHSKLQFGHSQLIKTRVHEIRQSDTLTTTQEFSYCSNLQLLTSESTDNSGGSISVTKLKYPENYNVDENSTNQDSRAIYELSSRNMHPIIEKSSYVKQNGTERILQSSVNKFKSSNGKILLDEVHGLFLNVPMNITNTSWAVNNEMTYHNDLERVAKFSQYDNHGQPECFSKEHNVPTSILWADIDKPNAKIVNALPNECLFIDFDLNKYVPATFNEFFLTPGYVGNSYQINSQELQINQNFPAGRYKLSFWAKGLNGQLKLNGSVIESIQAGSEFEFIEVEINYNSTINLLSLSGTGIIDEIRIHPLDAQMITFSYDRNHKTLIGTSTIQHQKQTFEYDDFMRLKNIFDSEDNLLTNNEYIYNEAITGLNVIKKHTARSPGFNHESQLQSNSNINEVLHEIQYIDDFGRIIQSIAVGDSPSEKDIVSIHDYDALGREKKQYLHFTATSNGGLYRGNAELLQNLFYGSLSSHAYSENSLENAPGGKLVETGHPGSAWKIGSGHEIKNDYRFNYPKEIRLFNSFGVSTTTYASNRLRVVQTEDENGHKTTTYMDQSGRTIMTDQSGAKTYFVFDDFGRTRFVIPPMAYKEMENTGIYNCNIPSIQNAIYHYVYDNLGNVIRKKIPGKNVELTFYDRLSRPVLTIDGKGKKSFIKYDILGRSIVTGLYSGSAMPSISDSLYEEESTTNFGYTLNNSFPSNQITVLGVDYYDHYDFDRDGIVSAQESYYKDPQDTFNNEFFDHPINKITGSLIAFFEPGSDSVDGYTVTKSYYDSRLRPIQSKMINRTGVEDMVFNLYDFKGNIIKTSKLHRSNLTTTNSFIISKDYEYDHGGRLLKTFVQINNGPKNLVSSKSYNEKGLLSSKKLGLDSLGLNYLQKLDYTYNVRNWLTGINDIDANCGAFDKFETPQIGEYTSRSVSNIYRTKMPKNVDNDLFSMRIAYNQTRHADALFDGNISEVTWQNECGSIARHYDFSYDSRNQLIAAKYYEGTDLNNLVETDEYSMSASYDLNGNLLSLKRNGQGNEIDNLSYTYNSANHLIQLEELADLSKGFQSQFNSASFHYDLNGNLSRDEHKGLDVNHNLFNLPNTFAFDSGDSIQIQFDASGKKLAKLTKENGQNNWMRKDYFGEFEYVDGNLEAIYFEEGRIVPIGSKWQFEYVIRDYLGNIRLSFADLNEDQKIDINDNEVLQENHYYPFGMTMEGPWQQISGTENAYQYNGKEMNNDFGLRWLDYGARWYDPAIGRWHSVDPLAEKFMNWSAYNYVFNNPVRLIDPDGAAPNDPIEQYRQLFQRVFKQAPKSVAKALFLRLQSLRESRKYGMQEMQADDYFEPITGVGQGALYRSGSIATNDLKGIISLNINGISVKGRIGGYKKKYSSLTNVSSIVFNSGRLGKGTSGGTTQAVSGFQIELKNSKTSVAYILIQDKAIFEAIRDSYYAAIEKEFQKLLNSNPELSDYYELMKAYQDAMDEYNKVRALNAREKSEKQQSKYDAAASRYEKTNERFKSLQRSFYRKYPN